MPRKKTEVVDPLAALDIDDAPIEVEAPVEVVRPVPESELTRDERRIRELENQLALERGKKDPEMELEPPSALDDTGNILIHFLEDGLTVLGHVWFRGQEIEFQPGGRAFRDTCDRHGRSWLELVDNEFGQVDRWGKVMFRRGPWPGKSWVDAAKVPFESLKPHNGVPVRPPTEAELERVASAEARRKRAAPVLPAN